MKQTYNELGEEKLYSLGIDLVELSRVRSIYRGYSDRLGRYLSKKELEYIRSQRSPVTALAEILAVKEAVFKALESPWFGLDGWKKIRLEGPAPHQFKVRFYRSLLKKGLKHSKIWINVASTKLFVLARVVIEKTIET